MMEIEILERYRDQAGEEGQAALATGRRPRRRGVQLGSTESALPLEH